MIRALGLLLLGVVLCAAEPVVVEAYFGYEVVEDRHAELAVLTPLLRTATSRAGLAVRETAPETGAWWLVHVVIGWRGTGEHRRLMVGLEVERLGAEGPWWREQVPLATGYTRAGAQDAFERLLARARAELAAP